MKLVCPECKNDVELGNYPDLSPDQVVECDKCGITLMIKTVVEGNIESEIVDEGK